MEILKNFLMILLISMTIISCSDSDTDLGLVTEPSDEEISDPAPGAIPEEVIKDELPEKHDHYVINGTTVPVVVDDTKLYVWLPQETYNRLRFKRVNEKQSANLDYYHYHKSCTVGWDSVIDKELLNYKNYVETFIYKDELSFCDTCFVIAPAYIDVNGENAMVQNYISIRLKNEDTDLELLKAAAKKYQAYIGKWISNGYFMICYGTDRKLSPVSVSNYLIESGEFALVSMGVLTPTFHDGIILK